jgi:hypothetical protein
MILSLLYDLLLVQQELFGSFFRGSKSRKVVEKHLTNFFVNLSNKEACERMYFYFVIKIRPVLFTVTEIQTNFTIKHNTSMPHNNVLRVSVHHSHHLVPLLQMFRKQKFIFTRSFFRSEVSQVHYYYLLK